MRLIFMGTPDFAVGTLEALIQAGHEIALVVTQPDKPKGRGKSVQFPPVKETALAHRIEVYQPKRIRNAECMEYLKGFLPDLIVVAAFGQILPKELLELPRYGCINVHASLLPRYRGAAPIQWAVMNGDKKSGVTIMQMNEGLDTGDILSVAEVDLSEDETGGSLFEKLAKVGAQLCVQTVSRIEAGDISPIPQEEGQATHVGMIKKDMGDLDWTRPALELERLIRGLDPWPSAFTLLEGRVLKIWKAAVVPENSGARPGCVSFVDKKSLRVQTGEGQLSLLEVQLQGKKRMPVDAFLRGFAVQEGTVLGKQP